MALNPEQRQVLSAILRIGRRRGASRKEIKAAVETGLVESNLSNPNHGDADSQGWRQERASLYKNPTNLDASINRFFDETRPLRDRYGRAGALAAAVQRPAAQYRGRYQEHSSQADQLLGRLPGAQPAGRGAQPRGRNTTTNTTTTVTPGVDNRVARAQLIQAFLSEKGADPVSFALRARELADVAPTSSSVTERSSSGGGARTPGDGGGRTGGGGSALASFATKRANVIDQQHLRYSWGGGHAGQTKIHDPVPLDCSGAVAKVLGIDPRHSSKFASWGRPGDGGGKGVTVYANNDHVLMKINGHFFGTSASNPGGGAGWIPQAQISPAYLSKFTARHSR